MKNVFYAILIGLVSIVMIINIFSGIVGGLWLVFTGGIGLVIAGIIAGFIMPWIYSIAVLPSFGLLALTVKLLEKGHSFLAAILGFLASFWEKSITWFWVAIVFYYYLGQSDHFNSLALTLAAYATAMAPLQSMASHEEHASEEGAGSGTTIGLFYAQLVFIIFTISFIFNFSPTGILWILLLVFAGIPAIIIAKAPKSTTQESGTTSQDSTQVDPLMSEAVNILMNYEVVSTPLFQRKMSIGFERAVNMINTLMIMNVIDGGGIDDPRKVLFNKDELQKVKNYFESLPKYDPSQFEEAEPVPPFNEKDSIYPQVKEFIKSKKEVTVADLQKKFDIGYSRGARIMDNLEEDGFVDSPIGTMPRKVLVAWQTADSNTNKTGQMIVETLKAFGIFTRIEEINKKKSGIEYCLEVAIGSSIENLQRLEKDIAMAVASPTGKVKIQAPIPGKSLIGITVPTKRNQT